MKNYPVSWFKWALINFLMAATLGVVMRFAFVQEISWLHYRNFLHAHSHVAILGWAYLGFFSLLVSRLKLDEVKIKKYQILFWATQFSVMGMAICFSLFGYQVYSISFSTLHVILSYIFVFYYWKDLRADLNRNRLPTIFIKTGLIFLLLSTLALWLMPVVILLEMQHKPIYYIAVQFYLHFQFNGWFIFTALGLFLSHIRKNDIVLPVKKLIIFYRLLFISCFLTFALAITWTNPLDALFYVNSSGVIIQLIALIYFLKLIKQVLPELKQLYTSKIRLLLGMSCFAFAFKIIIQTAVVIPYIGTIAYTVRNYVLGYLHLLLIGMVSFFLISYGIFHGFLKLDSIQKRIGLILFFIGFILTEVLLFGQGTMFWAAKGFIPFYYELLFGVSLFLPAGILMMINFVRPHSSEYH